MTILSFQSRVAYGYVGNSAAVFCLQRLGREVWPVDTVWYSNHPGHGRFGGRVRDAREVEEIVDGLEAVGALAAVEAALTGYLGSAAIGRVALRAVARAKAARAAPLLYCCDPVMGDREAGLYVAPELVGFFAKEAIAAADVLTPNQFELEVLAGGPLAAIDAVTDAACALRRRGPRVVLVSSVDAADLGGERIATLAAAADGCFLAVTPRLPIEAKGAGDILTAVFLARLLEGAAVADALAHAVGAVFAVIEATPPERARELRLIAAQDALAAPPPVAVTRLR